MVIFNKNGKKYFVFQFKWELSISNISLKKTHLILSFSIFYLNIVLAFHLNGRVFFSLALKNLPTEKHCFSFIVSSSETFRTAYHTSQMSIKKGTPNSNLKLTTMTSNERKDVFNTAKKEGYRSSAIDASKQTNGYNSVTHVGTNRTIVNGTTYYGASDAKKAIKGS